MLQKVEQLLYMCKVVIHCGMGKKLGARSTSNEEWPSVEGVPSPFQILAVLSDPNSVKILKMAYSGLKVNSLGFGGNLSLRQYYARMKRLTALGLIKKQGKHIYKTTCLGSLIYNTQKEVEDKAGRVQPPHKIIKRPHNGVKYPAARRGRGDDLYVGINYDTISSDDYRTKVEHY